jgi:transcriptional regulator with XRE-family HTH domain
MLGAELLARRKSLGLTQSELAERLGVASNTVARWERGELTIARPEMLRVMLQHIQIEMEHETNEQRHARNLRIAAETQAELAAREAAGPSPERDVAKRHFGSH